MSGRREWRPVYHLGDRKAVRAMERAREAGQAAMGMVIGLILLISLTAGALAATAMQHDPLVSNDVVQHLAYRALQSGIDSYLSAVNQNPNLVNCNSLNTSSSSTACPSSELPALDTWETVTGNGNNPITEKFMWTNPWLCFNTACSAVGSTAGQTLEYVKELVYGAAQNGKRVSFQSSYVNFTPENGFLTHIFWSNYESTVPASGQTANCTYDWNDNYGGPDINNQNNFNSSNCGAVFFGPGDTLYGPVYSNDSFYVDSSPNFGSTADPSTITTHDPNCLFVDPFDNHGTAATCSGANTADVGTYNSATSSDNAQLEPLPTTDTALAAIAAQTGCLYSGPTTIQLSNSGTTENMTVYSPNTPVSSNNDGDNVSTNPNQCGYNSTNGSVVNVSPGVTVAAPANGVVYVENTPSSQTCNAYANPYDGVSGTGLYSQLGLYYGQTATPDCEGDAFVSGTVSGALTIATQNDIIVDNPITYVDCGSSFNSQFANQCAYSSSAGMPNDALGLIAFAYVDVNRPLKTVSGTTSVMASCGGTGALAAPLCDPGASGLTIDAAILALNDGFGVNNYTFAGNGTNSGNTEGTLDVYGSISEDYRPAVGTFSNGSAATGYTKYYIWDSRLGYVNVPDYLDPGTPRWSIASTAVAQGVTCTTSTALPGYWTASNSYGTTPQSTAEPSCGSATGYP
jgi:hypothetical protein